MVKVRMNTADVAAEVKCLRKLIGMRCANVYDLSPKVWFPPLNDLFNEPINHLFLYLAYDSFPVFWINFLLRIAHHTSGSAL